MPQQQPEHTIIVVRKEKAPPDWPLGLMAAGGLAIIVALIFLVSKFGLTGKPNEEEAKTSKKPPKAVPTVALSKAESCKKLNKNPIIKLDTEAKLKDCNKAKGLAKSLLFQEHGAKNGAAEFKCLNTMWTRESGWSPWAENPSSGAWGIAQIHPAIHKNPTANGKPVRYGEWEGQVRWGYSYIKGAHESPCKALAFWNRTDPRCLPKSTPCKTPHGKHWY